jgi:hypothetical protein
MVEKSMSNLTINPAHNGNKATTLNLSYGFVALIAFHYFLGWEWALIAMEWTINIMFTVMTLVTIMLLLKIKDSLRTAIRQGKLAALCKSIEDNRHQSSTPLGWIKRLGNLTAMLVCVIYTYSYDLLYTAGIIVVLSVLAQTFAWYYKHLVMTAKEI